MEERQRAHQHVRLGEDVVGAAPAVVEDAAAPGAAPPSAARWCRRCGSRRRSGRRALSAKSRAASSCARPSPAEIEDAAPGAPAVSFGRISGTIQASGGAQVARQVDLKHRLDAGRQRDRLGDLLREVGLRERRQRHHHLGAGVAQDAGHVLGREQRVDRLTMPAVAPAMSATAASTPVRQHEGDGVARPDPEPAEEVGGPRHLRENAAQVSVTALSPGPSRAGR